MNENKNVPELRFPGFEGDWFSIVFGEVVRKIASGKSAANEEGEHPVYGSTGLISTTDNPSFEGLNILIARVGANAGLLNIADGIYGVTDNTLVVELDDSKNNVFFTFNLLKKFNLNKLVFGSGQPLITGGQLKKLKLYAPSLPEQQKIADFLSAVDKKIEQLTEKHRLLTQYKKGVMQQIFSQQIRFKDDEGNEYPEWEEKKLGDICIKKSSTIAANAIEDSKGVFKIYGASGELESVDFYDEETPYVAIVKDGAGVGRVQYCEAKSSVLGTLDKIFPVSGVQLTFLYEVLKGISFEKYTTGSTIPHIYFKDYKKELIGLPTGEEQQKIADFLTAIDNKIDQAWSKLEQAKAFKKGLLQKMFV